MPLATSAAQSHPALLVTTRRMRRLMLSEVSRLQKRPCGLDHSASPGTGEIPSGAQAGPARLPANPLPLGFGCRVRRAAPRMGPRDFRGVRCPSRLDSDARPAPRRVVRVRPCLGCRWRFDGPPIRVAPPLALGLKMACRLFLPSLPVTSSARCRHGALASPSREGQGCAASLRPRSPFGPAPVPRGRR